jgi:hypothetical protein
MLAVIDHFERTLDFIKSRSEEERERSSLGSTASSIFWQNVIGVDTGLQGISILVQLFQNAPDPNQAPPVYQSTYSGYQSVSERVSTNDRPQTSQSIPNNPPILDSFDSNYIAGPLGGAISPIPNVEHSDEPTNDFLDIENDEEVQGTDLRINSNILEDPYPIASQKSSVDPTVVPSVATPITRGLEMDPEFSGFAAPPL